MKMTKTVLLSTLLALGSISTAALAGDDGFYAGANIGVGKPNVNTPNGESKSSSPVGGLVLGYKINKYLGVEGEYTGIGKVKDKVSGSVKGDAASIAAIGFLPLSDEFNLYGKLGVAATKTSVSSSLAPANDASKAGVTYGLGGEYNFNKNIGLRLGWDHYSAAVKDATNHKDSFGANVVNIGAVYNF